MNQSEMVLKGQAQGVKHVDLLRQTRYVWLTRFQSYHSVFCFHLSIRMSPSSISEREVIWQELDSVLHAWADLYNKEQSFLVEVGKVYESQKYWG